MTGPLTPQDPLEARLLAEADKAEREAMRMRRLARPEDYVFDKSQEKYWDTLDNSIHTDKGVDASIPQSLWRVIVEEGQREDEDGAPQRRRGRPRRRGERLIKPSTDIQRVENDQFVEGSTWWPGMPKMVWDWFIDKDGRYPAPGRVSFNQYRPPPVPKNGQPAAAKRWLRHLRKVWPDWRGRKAMLLYFAHMVQHPATKANHCVFLTGQQGVGKDAALHPVRAAVGSWNTKEVTPDQILAPFNPHVQTLFLVVNEIRPTQEQNASDFSNTLKPLVAAPPDTIALNEKHLKTRYVVNVMRVAMTSNFPLALKIEPGDRRHLCLDSPLAPQWNIAEGRASYFTDLFKWFDEEGGNDHVAAWLRAVNVSKWDPKKPPPRTEAWHRIVDSWGGGGPLGGVLATIPNEFDARGVPIDDRRGTPDVVFGSELVAAAFDDRDAVEELLRAKRKRQHAMLECGYMELKNPAGTEWAKEDGGARTRSRVAFVRAATLGAEPTPKQVRAALARLESIHAAAVLAANRK